jgi:hypothetical protein
MTEAGGMHKRPASGSVAYAPNTKAVVARVGLMGEF